MDTRLVEYTVAEMTKGFQFNKLEGKGLFGLDGTLVIQPEYQRHYIYEGASEEAVIESVLGGYPLGLLYFVDNGKNLEVLDGQQRITSLGRFMTGKFAVEIDGSKQVFSSLPPELKNKIRKTKLIAYKCVGSEAEVKRWFQVVNITGKPLTNQELLNAIYSGPFITSAKKTFSNAKDPRQMKWSAYVDGKPTRQEVLEVAIKWASHAQGISPDRYLANHRNDKDADSLQEYFEQVIEWVSGVFPGVPEKEMRGLPWGNFYETYHAQYYNSDHMRGRVDALRADTAVTANRKIYEYLLGGEKNTRLLNVRYFDEKTIAAAYASATADANVHRVSNCRDCTEENGSNKAKIWKLAEMDADHIEAWSKGGPTTADNCRMLCIHHNRLKGNH